MVSAGGSPRDKEFPISPCCSLCCGGGIMNTNPPPPPPTGLSLSLSLCYHA